MSEEKTVEVVEPVELELQLMGSGEDTPAVAKNTDTPESHMIPKSRFDEVNKKLKELQSAQAKAEAERLKAEEAQLKEQNRYKELYEAEQKRATEAAARMAELERQTTAREVATAAGIGQLWQRLQGSTKEEMEADAKALVAILPKPAAPNLDAGKSGKPSTVNELELRQQAIRMGVNPDEYLKQVLR